MFNLPKLVNYMFLFSRCVPLKPTIRFDYKILPPITHYFLISHGMYLLLVANVFIDFEMQRDLDICLACLIDHLTWVVSCES